MDHSKSSLHLIQSLRGNIILIIILNLSITNIYTQIPKANLHTNEQFYYDFNGQVKSCEIRSFNSKGEYAWSLINNKNQDLHYNIDGQLIERYSYDIADFIYSDSIYIATKWTYHYLDNDLDIAKEIAYKNNETRHFWTYHYQGDSLAIKSFVLDKIDTVSQIKTINKDAKVIKYKKSKDQAFKLSSIREFNEEEQLKSCSNFDNEERLRYLSTYHYKLDSLENEIVIEHQVDLKNKKITKILSTKNKYGDIVSTVRVDEKEELVAESFWDFKYDDKNNWIEKISKWRIDRNEDFLIHTIKRKIEYFD